MSELRSAQLDKDKLYPLYAGHCQLSLSPSYRNFWTWKTI